MVQSEEQGNARKIGRRLKALGVGVFGFADLSGFEPAFPDESGGRVQYRRAVSLAIPMNPEIMAGIKEDPTEAYAAEYDRVNALLNEALAALQATVEKTGHPARAVPASERTDPAEKPPASEASHAVTVAHLLATS